MLKHLPLSALLIFLSPGVGLAATTGTLEGEMTVPYVCAVTVPSLKTLTETGTIATAVSPWTFFQNDKTKYTMTTVVVTNAPTEANVDGSITLAYGGGSGGAAAAAFDFTATEVSGSAVIVNGNLAAADTGTVTFTLVEQSRPRFFAGDYRMNTVLTCAQFAG
jgi:hypothetical protein